MIIKKRSFFQYYMIIEKRSFFQYYMIIEKRSFFQYYMIIENCWIITSSKQAVFIQNSINVPLPIVIIVHDYLFFVNKSLQFY